MFVALVSLLIVLNGIEILLILLLLRPVMKLLIVLNGIEIDSMNIALPDSAASFNRTKWN